MNLALFFEGTGQGVHGKKTNVSLAYEACAAEGQLLHLEPGPGTNFGYFLSGTAAGRDWRKIFASARRWFERNHNSALHLQASASTKVFLFGFSRGALLARHFAAWLDKLSIGVEYMGLWDTVDATPDLEVSEACPPNVKFARHAVAEHEARRFFAYVPLRGSRVEEELFPGSHSDVGGLYEDNHELADAARAWVVLPAVERGLRLCPDVTLNDRANPKTAVRHDSLRHLSNLFGLLRPAKRSFPRGMKRHSAGASTAVRAFVSLGSNIEPRADYLKRAIDALSALPETRFVRASSVIETEPVDVPAEFAAQKFLNQVAVFETNLEPLEFSRRMHRVEEDLGRVRTVRNGPRTIDIDLIDFGGLVLDTPELTLPHPRAHLRDFVLKPLKELDGRNAPREARRADV